MYQLCNTFLSKVDAEKYLGVLLSDDLSWGPHISRTAVTASQKLGFLKRNLKRCPAGLKRMAYVSVVRSGLEYASTIWDPHPVKHNNLLENVQRKATRLLTSDYQRTSRVTRMLNTLQLEPLEDRRRANRLTLLYKIIHENVAVPMEELDLQRNQRATRGPATQDRLFITRRNATELKNHFSARTTPEWNRLAQSITSADSVFPFKSRLSGTRQL